jgi:DNA-binding response OmpR family regulator
MRGRLGDGGDRVVRVLLLTNRPDGGKGLLPSLELLDHTVAHGSLAMAEPAGPCDVILVDATTELGAAAHACRTVVASDAGVPVIVVIGEGGLAALKAAWGFDDWMLPTALPAEVETRLRLAADQRALHDRRRPASIGDLSIDDETYVVRLRGHPLDLTYREFELLKHLAQHPARVFTRDQLLQEVWGYDYYGGTRTVDVHIRRLRAKLGPEYESLIGTVRGVGYKLDPNGPDAGRGAGEA